MRISSKGFTLSEALVALGIIGVISALVMPQVVNNISKHRSGATLARAVQQIQIGNKNIIQIANDSLTDNNSSHFDSLADITLADIAMNFGNNEGEILSRFEDVVPAYWGLVQATKSTTSENGLTLKRYNSNETVDSDKASAFNNSSNTFVYNFTRFPASVAIYRDRDVDSYEEEDFLHNKIAPDISIFIDTNTWDVGPNALGNDVFIFDLRNDGVLVAPLASARERNDGVGRTLEVIRNGFKL